jgi:ATP/maltotriose-dependent transcriptional regulator MalT
MAADGATPADVALARLGFGNGTRSAPEIHAALADLERLDGLKGAKALLGAVTSLAIAGDVPAATAMAERARAAPDWSDVNPDQRDLAETVVAWRAGRLPEAEAAARRLAGSTLVNGRYLGHFLLGEILVAQGKDAEGAAALERALSTRWSASNDARPWLDPRALLVAAGAHARSGDPARARARLDELLRLWQRADADLPALAEARALQARLAAQATQKQSRSSSNPWRESSPRMSPRAPAAPTATSSGSPRTRSASR